MLTDEPSSRRYPKTERSSPPASCRTGSIGLLVLLTALIAGPALGQTQPPATGEVIIVTGRGLPEALGESVYDTTRIDRERLTESASNRLEDILRDVPGFQLFRRSDSRSANPTSQGATLRALGGNASSRALLILDGVPQTDPFGGWVSWPAYSPQRLGLVRVTRGGGTGANGAGALAGTIELFSATPAQLRGIRGAIAYGSRDSLDAEAGLGVSLGAGFVSASASYARGDGFVPVVEEQRGAVDRSSPYEQTSVSVRAVAPVSSTIEFQSSGRWFSDNRERGTAFSGISTQGLDGAVRLVRNGRWRWSALGYVQTRQFRNSFAGVNAGRTSVSRVSEQHDVPSAGYGVRAEVRPPLGKLELRFGGEWRETEGETRERFNFQNGAATRSRETGGRTRTLGAFTEAAWQSGALTLSGGARLDRWRISSGFLDERVLATGAMLNDVNFADRSGWAGTARTGVAWRAADAITLRTAAYLGWRLPTLNELYRPFRVGADATAANARLAPERLRGIEAGVEYRPTGDGRVGVTVFANRLEDAIANVTLGRGPGVFPGAGFVADGGEYRQRRNLDAIRSKGIEVDGRLDFGSWSLAGGYSFADARVDASGPALPLHGLRPAQTPKHSLSSTLGWRGSGDVRASLSARFVSSQFEDDLNAQRLPDALTFDATASLPLTRALALEARAENFTNKRVVAAINGAGVIERATPRTLWIGLRLRD